MPGDTPMPFDPEYDVPLFYCHVCARELRKSSCRKCGTEDNTASNWIPNGKKERPAAPLAFDAALAALDVENVRYPDGFQMEIIGLDAVRAAHRAEVERAVAEERAACARIMRAFREQSEPGDDVRLTLEQAEQDICARGAKS